MNESSATRSLTKYTKHISVNESNNELFGILFQAHAINSFCFYYFIYT